MTDAELDRELKKADLLLKQRQARWEVPKAMGTLLAASAVFCGFVIAASAWLHPQPQTITVRIEQPLHVVTAPEVKP